MHTSEKDILQAQKWLQNCGSSIKATGKMTIGMSTALMTFQRNHNLSVTGKLDKETWKALKKENSFWKRFMRKNCGHRK